LGEGYSFWLDLQEYYWLNWICTVFPFLTTVAAMTFTSLDGGKTRF